MPAQTSTKPYARLAEGPRIGVRDVLTPRLLLSLGSGSPSRVEPAFEDRDSAFGPRSVARHRPRPSGDRGSPGACVSHLLV